MKAKQFIKDYTRRCSNELIFTTEEDKTCKEYNPWLTPEQALSAVKIAREEVIEKACYYFAPHISDNSGGYDRARIIEGFKKYMEE